MATRPELHIAVAKTKNKASDYNDNFDMMMDYVDDTLEEAQSYVDSYMPTISAGTSGKFLTNNGSEASWSIPINTGTILYYGFTSAPSGWLICDGSAISRTTYSALFNAIGTTFGAGDGSTTFNLPNLIGRFAEGNSTTGTYKDAGLPNITGSSYGQIGNAVNGGSGALYTTTVSGSAAFVTGAAAGTIHIDASRSNSIYGRSSTVQPKSLTLLPIIKY